MRRSPVRIFLWAAVFVLAVAACSSGGGNSGGSGSGGGGGAANGGNTSKANSDCAQANLAIGYVDSNFVNRTINNGDVHTFALDGRNALRNLRDKAPANVQSAMNDLADTYNDFATQTQGVTYNPRDGGTPPAAFTQAVQVFQQPRWQQADVAVAASGFLAKC